ncbi:ankyrin repeat-containing domain protein [Trichoderma sp. SZMC 28013]
MSIMYEYTDDSDSSSEPYIWTYARVNETRAEKQSTEAHVRQLIENGEPIPPIVLWGAVEYNRPEVVDLLLSAGVDPNQRHAKAEEVMSLGEHDWLDRVPDRTSENDRDTKYPLGLAAIAPCYEEGKEKAYRMVQSLLRHGADPYAIFADQLEEPLDPELDVRLLFPGQEISQPQDVMAVVHHRVQRDEKMLDEDIDRDIPWKDFGLRSVIHSILESSGVFKAFLESPEFMMNLKLEHRDPQGRTLFLSACRSSRGADALLDKPQRWNDGEDSKLDRMGQHLVTFPANVYSETSSGEALPRTAIQALLNLGADPLATDNQGKHALHQLLDAPSWVRQESPVNHQTLRYLIDRFPSLINQPDHNGLTPIHSSIRRMWSYANYPYDGFYPLEDTVLDLINAGADIHARDAQGNTVIHYLADGFLDAFKGAEGRRKLFYTLLDKYQCASYINLANNMGLTPIQLVLSYTPRKNVGHGEQWSEFWSESPEVQMQTVDEELFGKFDDLGVDWMVRDRFGRTLLHGVARTETRGDRALWRCKYLIQKGIDPLACDFEGKTARDLASEYQFRRVSKILEEAEQAAAHGKA